MVNKYCVSCHQTGGQAGKYPFTSKDLVVANLVNILKDLELDRMPHGATVIPDPACGGADRFQGLHLLTPEEKQAFKDWEAAGAPDCRAAAPDEKAAAASKDPDTSIWQNGKPDLILQQTSGGFEVQPGKPGDKTKDFFRNFNLPDDFFKNSDRYLTGFEIKPGNLAPASDKEPFPIVHHVHVFVIPNGMDAEKGLKEYQEKEKNGTLKEDHLIGKTGWESRTFDFPTEIVGSWFPGQQAVTFPPGIAQKIPKGAKLMMQIHYTNYNERPITDNTSVGLYFARTPVQKERIQLEGVNEHFLIKAGDPDHTEKTRVTVPCDAELWSLLPHQHQLGTMNEVNAIEPGGKKWCVEKVKWNFDHQYAHDLNKPLHIKKGTVLEETCHWDNRDKKYFSRQINTPAIDIDWGPIASKEMCRIDYAITCNDKTLKTVSPKLGKVSGDTNSMKVSGTNIKNGALIEMNGKIYNDTVNENGVLSSASAARDGKNIKTKHVAILNPDGGTSESNPGNQQVAASKTGDFLSADKIEKTNTEKAINFIYKKYVKAIFQNKCVACHSSKAEIPAYAAVFPIVKKDIQEAQTDLDFSTDYPFRAAGMPEQIQLLREINGSVTQNTMPPNSYLAVHWNKYLTSKEASVIKGWTAAAIERLEPLSPSRDLSYLPTPAAKANKAMKQCSSCHNSANASGGFSVENFKDIQNSSFFNKANPQKSKIYEEIKSGKMPKGSTLTNEEKEAFYKWLELGAPDVAVQR